MLSGSKIIFIPGDVSIDILRAIVRGVDAIRAKKPIVPRPDFRQARGAINNLKPSIKKTFSVPLHPVRRINGMARPIVYETKKAKAKRIRRELIDAGATIYGLFKSESRSLPKILHPTEHVEAVVYGQHRSSSVMLVATDERILYVDKKPMALFLDEVSYEVVSGIEFEIHTFFATLILHTPVKNFDIRFANLRCADKFARHIEFQRLIRPHEETSEQSSEPEPIELEEDLAGYYWLPMEEEEENQRRAIR